MTKKLILIVLAAAAVLLIGGGLVSLAHALHDGGNAGDRGGHTTSTATAPAPTSPSAAAVPSARVQAFRAAAAFCQPDESKDTWQRTLSPYLTSDAWRLFQATVPGNVPCAAVVDDPQPVGDTQTSTDQAYQLTAATGGPVTVTLHRDNTDAPWLVSYITPGGQQ